MRQLTNEQKKKFVVYKEIEEPSFPEDQVWKVWVPMPETMPGGLWMQLTTQREALSVALTPYNQLCQQIAEDLYEGGW